MSIHNRGAGPDNGAVHLASWYLMQLWPEYQLGIDQLDLTFDEQDGLLVLARHPRGQSWSETISPARLVCTDEVLRVDLGGEGFLLAASPGRSTRHVELIASADDGLLIHYIVNEQGLGLMVLPISVTSDSWAQFTAAPTAASTTTSPTASVEATCPDLNGEFGFDAETLTANGQVVASTAERLLFRPEFVDPPVELEERSAENLRVRARHEPADRLTLDLMHHEELLATRTFAMVCDSERWLAKGDSEMETEAWVLGAVLHSEDLTISRDADDALTFAGVHRRKGVFLLVLPTAKTERAFWRLLPVTASTRLE